MRLTKNQKLQQAIEENMPWLILRCPHCGSKHVTINPQNECQCKECTREFIAK